MSDAADTIAIPRRLLTIFKVLTSLFMILVLWILIVEVGLRFIPIPGLRSDDINPTFLENEDLQRNQAHPYLAYSLRPNWRTSRRLKLQASHNSLGFRGPETTWDKPQGVFRIACLGGSSTYGHTPTSNEHTWPARLEYHLSEARKDRRIEVINAGVSGYSTFESLANLAFRVVDLRPDLVLVYHSINDVRCALYPDPVPDNTHWRAVWPRVRASPIESYLEHSISYLIWRRYCTDYFEMSIDLGSYAIVDFGKKRSTAWPPPDRGFRNMERNLHSIAVVAREHGAEPVFITLGADYRDFAGRATEVGDVRGMARATEIIRRVAKEKDILVIEAAKVLESTAGSERGKKDDEQGIFTHEVHLTNRGADLLAKTIAEALLRADRIPK